jgi:ATP-binding cassette subfamily B (MDR/TAP) protein 7
MNYETVKAFNNELLERSRYKVILKNIKNSSMIVQKSLANLNMGQQVIFSTGLTLNLMLAAWDVSTGRLTPGDFVLI